MVKTNLDKLRSVAIEVDGDKEIMLSDYTNKVIRIINTKDNEEYVGLVLPTVIRSLCNDCILFDSATCANTKCVINIEYDIAYHLIQ